MEKTDKFSEVSAIHGIRHIFSSKQNKFFRVFWFFAVLLSFCGLFFYLQNSWIKLMYEPEVLIKTRERNAADFPFPAITVCPNHFARHEIFNLSDLTEKDKYSDEECKSVLSNLLWAEPNAISYIKKFCPELKLLSLNIPENIVKSSIASEDLFVELSVRFSQRTGFSGIGPCYTFNGLSYSQLFNTVDIHEDFKQFQKFFNETKIEDNSSWSPENGLEIKNGSDLERLNLSQIHVALGMSPENTENLASASMFKLFLHKPNEIVTTLNDDYLMNFNESKRYRLKVKSRKTDDALRQFSPESRKCYFENEKQLKFFKSYTKLNCEWECRINAVLRDCGCVLYYMPRDNQTKVCFNCISNPTECDCFAPCNDFTFEMTSESLQVDATVRSILDIPSTYTFWSGLFLAEDFVEEIEYYSAYRTQNFIAEFGGFLGLFMGCSLLSLVEILFYFLLTIRSILIKIWQKITRQAPKKSKTRVIQVIAAKPQNRDEKFDKIVESVNYLKRLVEDIQMKNSAIEARLFEIESKISDNLIVEDC